MYKVDRTGWAAGPWDTEPDRLEWRVGSLYCRINRAPKSGHLNGYLGVPAGHPWYGKHCGEIEDAPCHGGLTFSAPGEDLSGTDPRYKLDPVHAWLVGFDCAHAGDRAPGRDALFRAAHAFLTEHQNSDRYRDVLFVEDQLHALRIRANGLPTFRPEWWVRVVDGTEVEVCHVSVPVANRPKGVFTVTGDGAEMLRQWVRMGPQLIGIVADWLEDHPEHVTCGSAYVGVIAQGLRDLPEYR